MTSLLDQELREANGLLHALRDAESRASFFLGMTPLCLVVWVAVLFSFRLFDSTAFAEEVGSFALLILGMGALGLWWRWKARCILIKFQAQGRKLQRAGISVRLAQRTPPELVVSVSSAATGEPTDTIEFERAKAREVRAQVLRDV